MLKINLIIDLKVNLSELNWFELELIRLEKVRTELICI